MSEVQLLFLKSVRSAVEVDQGEFFWADSAGERCHGLGNPFCGILFALHTHVRRCQKQEFTSILFPQQQNFAMGSLAQISSGAIRCSFNTRFWRVLVQIQGCGGSRCRYLVRFRRVPVKIPAEAPEGSVRFRRVPVQIPCEVPEVSGAGTRWGSGGLWWR